MNMHPPRKLRIDALRAAAARKGDTSGYAIAQRTGFHQSTISRWLHGQLQPGANALMHLCETYDVPVDELMPRSQVQKAA